MTKAYSLLTVKSATESDDERIITGIASTPSTDRDNDIIEPTGAEFSLPMPLLWQHNHNQPIGEVITASVTDDGIEFTAKIAKITEDGTLKERIDEAWQSIKSGLVKCLSVGFKMKEYNYLEDSWGLHIKGWEWYELSVVTVPANPDAVITSVKNFGVKEIKKAFEVADLPIKSSDKPAFGQSDDGEPNTSPPKTDPVSDVAGSQKSGLTLTSGHYINLVDPSQHTGTGGVKLL